ncbi:Fibroblast growth factor receptor 2 [Holothuria leucospilota]|uniref:Fibroblast growth factor receptor 2 n=1 Tax=Holothuria leucospilota TaxID=206669 RepID=A0A9Q1BWZ7_HOLLE|nr:Fibroblast growth factor receptor 2 [Holothuria leucospilota]
MQSFSLRFSELFVLSSFLVVYSVNYEHLTSVGGTALLQCAANVTETSIVIIWQHNGKSILNHDPESAQIRTDKFTSRVIGEPSTVELEISNVSFNDAGNYSCILYLQSGVPKKNQMTLKVQGYPSLSLNSNITVEGDFLEATCCVQFAPPFVDEEIRWVLEEFPDLPNVDTATGMSTSSQDGIICNTLKIQTIRDYNNKQLRCYVGSQPDLSAAVSLDILYPPTVDILGISEESTLSVEINTLLNITCVADGNPLPTVTLEREDGVNIWKPTTLVSEKAETDENIKVSFLRAKSNSDDKGYYRCYANNLRAVDASTIRFYVEITSPTTIQMLMPPSIKIREGGELVISCQTEGNPEPKVQLQRNVQTSNWNSLSTTPIPIFKQDLVSTWMFRFDDQEMDLTGSYRCVGYNGVGEHAISGEVIVEGKRWLLCGKCLTESKRLTREGRHLPSSLKEVEIIQEYEENLELYNTISDDNEAGIAKHIQAVTKKDMKFISKLKSGRHTERWLGLLKSTASFSSDKNVYVLFLSGNEKTMSALWSRHLHFVVKLPRQENIVTTLGTFEDNGIAYCIQEYLPFGNLRTFLETEYGQSYIYGNTVEPIPQEFVSFALDVICGMEFLRYHGWIHPGLCAQKVMLDNQTRRCKLHDFCHMCNRTDKINLILENETQNGFLQIAPEVIQRDEYSYRSDVWAVGVLLWEIFSYGRYDVMTQCWVFDPMSRPTFIDVKEGLKSTAETYQMTFIDKEAKKYPAAIEQEMYAREIHSS